MGKRYLLIALALLIVVAAAVQAQDAPPLTDPTVEAAVSALLAQTQTAADQQATSSAATQTVGAALSSALTATAQAQTVQAAPTPMPVSFDVSGLHVAGTTIFDMPSGAAGSAGFLAPDGQHFAYLAGKAFCLYAETGQQDCIDLAPMGALDSGSPRWSPDSRYVAFNENFFQYFREPDIWVWDTVGNTLTDITDDGLEKVTFLTNRDETMTTLDLLPHWLPDGRIVFLRYASQNGDTLPPDVYAINPDGSGLEQLGTINSVDAFAIYTFDVSAEGIVYIYYPAHDSPFAGVWISDLSGANARMLYKVDGESGLLPASVDFSADGRYVLVTFQSNLQPSYQPEDSAARVIDVASGRLMLIDPGHFVGGAGWSPQGSALVYVITAQGDNIDANGLYIAAAPGDPGALLLAGDYTPTSIQWRQPIGWGANNTVLVAGSHQAQTVLAHLD